MFDAPDRAQSLLPDDAFHHSSNWREISREEAIAAASFARVVVVFRNGCTEYADWFTRDQSFFLGVGPYEWRGLRYYVYRDRPVVRLSTSGGEARAATPEVDRRHAERVRKPIAPEVKQKTWIEIELLDDSGVPVAGEPYTVVLPDGSKRSGTLDSRGRARFDGIDPGTCQVGFPEIDHREWQARN